MSGVTHTASICLDPLTKVAGPSIPDRDLSASFISESGVRNILANYPFFIFSFPSSINTSCILLHAIVAFFQLSHAVIISSGIDILLIIAIIFFVDLSLQ